ncbi:unnamed protein product [Cercopithifilaria johnstoni]|uniref:Uncharacterized protein n=1 Tax=Cercopithifilaria johnstoni TaxID=2874296 RepID=A0A8J2Q3Z4_9BILA|nr:unnamed protein product [Cercopithifilaria johnstoni]
MDRVKKYDKGIRTDEKTLGGDEGGVANGVSVRVAYWDSALAVQVASFRFYAWLWTTNRLTPYPPRYRPPARPLWKHEDKLERGRVGLVMFPQKNSNGSDSSGSCLILFFPVFPAAAVALTHTENERAMKPELMGAFHFLNFFVFSDNFISLRTTITSLTFRN